MPSKNSSNWKGLMLVHRGARGVDAVEIYGQPGPPGKDGGVERIYESKNCVMELWIVSQPVYGMWFMKVWVR